MAAVRRPGPFKCRLSPLYHLRRLLLPGCIGRAGFSSPEGVDMRWAGRLYTDLRHAAASVRRRVLEAPH